MNNKLIEKIKNADFSKILSTLNYRYFSNGEYNVNIIGVRADMDNRVTNRYDDAIVVEYKENNKLVRKVWAITTEPGSKFMRNPSNVKGTAILVPGQYNGVYKIDLHRGKYKALCQRNGSVKVYRDKDRDNIYDCNINTIDKGWFGINIHRSNETYTRGTIDGYSAGCQVFNNPKDFAEFMKIINKSASIYGNKFTYTLITENDLCIGK